MGESVQGAEVNVAKAGKGLRPSMRWIEGTARRSSGFGSIYGKLPIDAELLFDPGWPRE
jgi:hypothetical protein